MTQNGNGTLHAPAINHSVTIPAPKLHPHPGNVRETLGDLSELSETIARHGLLNPLTVIPHPEMSGHYYVVAGHRRLVAGRRAGLDSFPCVVRQAEAGSPQVTEMMLVENCQRADLSPVEKALAMGALRDAGKSAAQIARAIGMTDATVCNYLALLDLDEGSLARVRDGAVPVTDAVRAVRKQRAAHRRKAGRADRGSAMAATCEPDHFTGQHPLARKAQVLCDAREHNARRRLGSTACGQCWETVIREDERTVTAALGNGVPMPEFSAARP
jgi:ParB family transcriptional regulator, chromosome partitioning protein